MAQTTELQERFLKNERLTTLINHLLVSLMLASAVVSFIQFAEHIQPSWNGSYLIFVTVVMGMEAMYVHRMTADFDFFSKEFWIYHLSEGVAILVVMKLVTYLVYGFDRLLVDLPLWEQDFFTYFFNGEYLLGIGLVFTIRMIAGTFEAELSQLEGDEKVLRMEMDSGISADRPEIRRRIADLILIVGVFMILFAALPRAELEALWGERPPLSASVVNILIYFILGLILLGLAQFSVLRVHWGLERIPISRNLAWRWAAYSVVFLAAVALIALLLPTRYSVGLLDALSYILYLVVGFLGFLGALLLLPFAFILSLFARLFGQAERLPPPNLDELQLPPTPAGGNLPWLELLKSLLFWLVLAGIIGYSLYHYIARNTVLIERLRRIPLFSGIFRLWHWLKGWLRGVKGSVVSTVQSGFRRISRSRSLRSILPDWSYTSLRRMSPRQRVIFFYLAMVRRGGEKGVPRRPSQTPYEYSRQIGDFLPEVEGEIDALTDEFSEARYSLHKISLDHASSGQRYWDRIRRALRKVTKR